MLSTDPQQVSIWERAGAVSTVGKDEEDEEDDSDALVGEAMVLYRSASAQRTNPWHVQSTLVAGSGHSRTVSYKFFFRIFVFFILLYGFLHNRKTENIGD